MYYGWWDPTYILIIIGAVICMIASARVKSTFHKYSNIRSASNLTGAEVARMILESQGIMDVEINHIRGELSDNYNPKDKTLNLSDSTYASSSVAAIGVAAHECGHAVQHHKGYAPIAWRNAILPFASLGSSLSWILIIVGVFLRSSAGHTLIQVGIIAFSAVVLFQLVTLPVEFNASRRAVKILRDNGILDEGELSITKKVLGAAAMTYVASAASSILQLLRLVLLFGGSDDD